MHEHLLLKHCSAVTSRGFFKVGQQEHLKKKQYLQQQVQCFLVTLEFTFCGLIVFFFSILHPDWLFCTLCCVF